MTSPVEGRCFIRTGELKTMKALSCLLLIAALYISFSGEALAQYACVRGDTPIQIEGSIVQDDMAQLGRITRDGRPSSCGGDTGSLENQTFLRRDTHSYANPYNETVCVRVEMDFTGCESHQMQSVAYSSFNPLAPATNILGDSGYSTIGKGSYSFSVGPNASFSVGVNEVEQATGCALYKLKITYLRNCRQAGTDVTNDGQADPTVFRTTPQGGTWYTLDSETGQAIGHAFGAQNDISIGGSDYTGDGRSDLSVYRPSDHTWYYATNPDAPGTNFVGVPWGQNADKPVAGDFDADGKNDIAIFRPFEGRFYILRSSDGVMQSHQWGVSSDTPITGDFDGDTATDIAITRQTAGGIQWWILKSNYRYGFHIGHTWGANSDRVVPGDYDGDTITDIATYRPSTGTFYVYRSSDNQMMAAHWGTNGDVPQPADYDGDGRMDFAVYRPSTGIWYIFNSGTETTRYVNWGAMFDQPMTTAYKIQGAVPPAEALTSE
jgi:hypothetical protein